MPNPVTLLTRVPKRTIKTITFTGGAAAGQNGGGAVPIATVSGLVCLAYLGIQCTTTLVSAGGGTIALGTAGNTGGLIAATTATTLTNTAGTQPKLWRSATPDIGVTVSGLLNAYINLNMIITVATADITAGVLEFDIMWYPLSNNALIV